MAVDELNPRFDPVLQSVSAYTACSGEYESVHATKMADVVARFAGCLPIPSLILDAGCGPGRDLARFINYGHVPRGVDLNPAFATKANTCAPTLRGDLREVGTLFPPGTFGGIWASASLVHLPVADTERVLAQFACLIRPGGKLYACVKCVGRTGWLDEDDGRRWYTVWDADDFALVVANAGFDIEQVDKNTFVEVWATRAPTELLTFGVFRTCGLRRRGRRGR